MLINITDSRLVIGHMNILPGEKVPALPLTSEQQADVDRLVKSGKLVEKPVEKPIVTPIDQPIVEKPKKQKEAPKEKPLEN